MEIEQELKARWKFIYSQSKLTLTDEAALTYANACILQYVMGLLQKFNLEVVHGNLDS
jgi:hypothetical protein